jgi:hypothetical protein
MCRFVSRDVSQCRTTWSERLFTITYIGLVLILERHRRRHVNLSLCVHKYPFKDLFTLCRATLPICIFTLLKKNTGQGFLARKHQSLFDTYIAVVTACVSGTENSSSNPAWANGSTKDNDNSINAAVNYKLLLCIVCKLENRGAVVNCT